MIFTSTSKKIKWLVLFAALPAHANEIYITQTGDSLALRVEQRSADNYVNLNSTGNTNDISITQGMHYDGSTYWVDTDETGGHEAYWTITGANNTVWSSQTDVNRGGGGGSPQPSNPFNNTLPPSAPRPPSVPRSSPVSEMRQQPMPQQQNRRPARGGMRRQAQGY